jgi:uncharacterized membrane protein
MSPGRAAALLIAALTALNLWRAATIPITTDEAFTFELYVQGNWRWFINLYDANHHVLHSLLARLSCLLFGPTELALRLPALIAGVFFLAGAWRLLGAVCLNRWTAVAGVALLGLHPLVADFLSLARGYSLALAFWIWGFYRTHRALDGYWSRRMLLRVGVSLGLAVAANLTFAVPAAALGLSFALLAWRRRGRDCLAPLVERCAIPAIVIAFVVLILPLRHATPANFYFGSPGLLMSWRSLTGDPYSDLGRDALAAAMLAAALALLSWGWRRWTLAAATLAFSLGGVLVLRAAGAAWPHGRTGIYLAVQALLAVPLLAGRAGRWGVWAAALLAAVFAGAVPLDHYRAWRIDAGTRPVLRRLAEFSSGEKTVAVAAPHPLQMPLAFTAHRLGRAGRLRVEEAANVPHPRWLVLRPKEDSAGYDILFTDKLSGLRLAEREHRR